MKKIILALLATILFQTNASSEELSYDYFPLIPKLVWNYSDSSTTTVSSETELINGVEASGLVDSGSEIGINFYSNDQRGLRLHKIEEDDAAGSDDITFNPPITIAGVNLSPNETHNSNGTIVLEVAGFGRFDLDYNAQSTVVGPERITVAAGQFDTIKITFSVTYSGNVNGSFISETGTQHMWLAKGIGPIQWTDITSEGTSTVSLSSYNLPTSEDTTVYWRNRVTGQLWLYKFLVYRGILSAPNAGDLFPLLRKDEGVGTESDFNWKVVSTADFDGDGELDFLWRHAVTGNNWLYLMDDNRIKKNVFINRVTDQNWKVAGTGDFDGDRKADILWRNVSTGSNWFYFMDGARIRQRLPLNTVRDQNWKVESVADFDGDGMDDILWRNATTGVNWIYLMNGSNIKLSSSVDRVADLNWKIAAVADFNDDGKADIYWHNQGDGSTWMYTMNGVAIESSTRMRQVPDLNWQVVAAGNNPVDYVTGKNTKNIFWHNNITGANWYYEINPDNPSTLESEGLVNSVSDLNWQVVNSK